MPEAKLDLYWEVGDLAIARYPMLDDHSWNRLEKSDICMDIWNFFSLVSFQGRGDRGRHRHCHQRHLRGRPVRGLRGAEGAVPGQGGAAKGGAQAASQRASAGMR